jgi:hypothetical protein
MSVITGRSAKAWEKITERTYLNNPIVIDVVKHVIHNGVCYVLRAAHYGQSKGGGIQVKGKLFSSKQWFS